MITIGIESSCDDTAVALLRDEREILSSMVCSQTTVHQKFGGVVPEIASREHLKAIDPLFREVLATAKIKANDIDMVAVTQGPGLVGALLVGISFAKGLALGLKKPLVPVNHVEAHAHGALLNVASDLTLEQIFPSMTLVVSGGHTNLYYMTSPVNFKLMAHSLDDACGECFDKVAKILGLSYPGGPQIERLAKGGDPSRIQMPRMIEKKSDLKFSYSGLKTHMVYTVREMNKREGKLEGQILSNLCAAFQEEALSQLVRKIKSALFLKKKISSLIIAGGVAANQRFRDMLKEKISLPIIFPEMKYCSDNAAMVASLGYSLYQQEKDKSVFFNHDWDAFSRYLF